MLTICYVFLSDTKWFLYPLGNTNFDGSSLTANFPYWNKDQTDLQNFWIEKIALL